MSGPAMTVCPKCGFEMEGHASECVRCGVVFRKYQRTDVSTAPPHDAKPSRIVMTDPAGAIEWWVRAALLLTLAWWTWTFATTAFGPRLIDSVLHLPNLVFHEAGHVLFMPLGRFMTSLGGSLFQCALPLALAGAFLRQKNAFGAVVCVWWAGQNLVDVAPYIADARALRLVLLGGRTGAEVEGHDWEFILTQLGWLHRDRVIGLWTYRVGLATMLAALAGGIWLLKQKRAAQQAARP